MCSLPGKAYAKVFERRCRPVVEPHIFDDQCGFRAVRGITDQILTLQKIIEKFWQFNRELYIWFIDLEKAYDRVPRVKLFEPLKEYGVGDNP